MVIFLSMPNQERINFFKEIKKRINTSWEKFYPKYGISRSTFFNYLSGRYEIPKNLFLAWKNLIGDKTLHFTESEKKQYLPKQVPIIKMDEKMAEILGILNGDGHLSNFKYEVCIVGDLREEEYYSYLKNLFESKFGLPFTLRREKSAFKLRCYSKGISGILFSEYHLPKGNKIGHLKIPSQVHLSKKFLRAYHRGLFDTDGSIYFRRKNEPVVQITSADEVFLKEVKDALNLLGFTVSKGNQRIFIYGKSNVKRFFEEIKPANSKHLKKYQNYFS